MRACHYNVFVPDGEQILALNLLSRAAAAFSADAYADYESFLDENTTHINDDGETFRRYLLDNLFIVEDDFDELAYIRYQSNAARFDNRELALVVSQRWVATFRAITASSERAPTGDPTHLSRNSWD